MLVCCAVLCCGPACRLADGRAGPAARSLIEGRVLVAADGRVQALRHSTRQRPQRPWQTRLSGERSGRRKATVELRRTSCASARASPHRARTADASVERRGQGNIAAPVHDVTSRSCGCDLTMLSAPWILLACGFYVLQRAPGRSLNAREMFSHKLTAGAS
jgi:hypothetical protein